MYIVQRKGELIWRRICPCNFISFIFIFLKKFKIYNFFFKLFYFCVFKLFWYINNKNYFKKIKKYFLKNIPTLSEHLCGSVGSCWCMGHFPVLCMHAIKQLGARCEPMTPGIVQRFSRTYRVFEDIIMIFLKNIFYLKIY